MVAVGRVVNKLDKFNCYGFPMGSSVMVKLTIPDDANWKTTIKALRNAGLTVPNDAEIFWITSKYCKISHNGRLIGELFYSEK